MTDRNESRPPHGRLPADPALADDARFDRLVDGELPADEYRALVASLDQEPGGWRNCALAFLESQALADELGEMRQLLDLSPAAAAKPAERGGGGTLRLGTLLAMAASFAVAFGLGITLPGIWQPGEQENPPGGNLNQGLAADGGVRHEAHRPIGNVRVVVNGAGGQPADAGEVPVYEIGQSLDEYLQQSEPALDPFVLHWLQQNGHQVEMQQQYIPGQLEDGRPMYVPVEQYKITPLTRSY